MLMAQHAAKKESSYVEYEERCKIRGEEHGETITREPPS